MELWVVIVFGHKGCTIKGIYEDEKHAKEVAAEEQEVQTELQSGWTVVVRRGWKWLT